jgi:hypothetical protein
VGWERGIVFRNFRPVTAAGYAKDSDRAERLWRLNEEIVWEVFDI